MDIYNFLVTWWLTAWWDIDLNTITLFTCDWFTIKAIDVFNFMFVTFLSLITCYLFIVLIYRLFKALLGVK